VTKKFLQFTYFKLPKLIFKLINQPFMWVNYNVIVILFLLLYLIPLKTSSEVGQYVCDAWLLINSQLTYKQARCQLISGRPFYCHVICFGSNPFYTLLRSRTGKSLVIIIIIIISKTQQDIWINWICRQKLLKLQKYHHITILYFLFFNYLW
jgi:hypothetical protein